MVLNFLVEAKRAFGPLASRFSLRYVAGSEWQVRYEGNAAFLNINFDNARSCELGVELGKVATTLSERPFSLGEVLRLRGASSAAEIDGLQVSNQAALQPALKRLAELTLAFASDFISGDEPSFVELERWREREVLEYAEARDLRIARAEAERAWINKDHARVIKIYEKWEPQLTASEIRRLQYSRRHREGAHGWFA